jgi:hypothetical protein
LTMSIPFMSAQQPVTWEPVGWNSRSIGCIKLPGLTVIGKSSVDQVK